MNIGQFYITGISGTSLSSFEEKYLREHQIGGVILFSRNYENIEQLVSLVNQIQGTSDGLPLFVSVDQEGGRVQRFKEPFSIIPPMLKVSETDSPKSVFEIHKIMGEELSACGVNLNFSPVCDIFSNPNNTVIGDRAFGKKAGEVEKLIVGAIRGLRLSNVLACAKHFPGHGDTFMDSHEDLPRINKSWNELEETELIPFKKAKRAKLEFLMMSHVINESIDEIFPASLSKITHDYLINNFNYSKLIISDDMEMGAIIKNYSVQESTKLAFEAGTDILCYRSLETCLESIDYVSSSLGNGLEQSIFKKKAKKIYNCKGQFFPVFEKLNAIEVKKKFENSKNQELVNSLLT